MSSDLKALLRSERRRQRGLLRQSALCALLVACSAVSLLGLSGWFITAAALAGSSGPLVARAFNYMLPSAAIRLLAIVRTGARYGERMASHAAALKALAHLRAKLFGAVASMPAERAFGLHLGDLSARLVQDVDAIEGQFVRLSAPWQAAGGTAVAIALILLGGWLPALTTALCLILLLVAADRLATRIELHGRSVQSAAGSLKDAVGALTNAAPELRCYALEPWAVARISAQSENLADAQRTLTKAFALFDLLQALAMGFAAVAALLLSAHAGAPRAAMAALAAVMAVDSLAVVVRDFAARGTVREAEARLNGILSADTIAHPADEIVNTGGATIAFDGGTPFPAGSRVAITGVSGAGKSTLVEQLIALRCPYLGRIAIDGHDLATLSPNATRRLFAWAPQDASLLAGTVRDNLLLAQPDADDAALWAALRDAAIDDRISNLPGALDGWIGENGASLSGGERRRLSLARAYLAAAPWLLLDEPTEGLDHETEALVVSRLRTRLELTGQGLLLVSHRPAVTALCDMAIVVESDTRSRVKEPGFAASSRAEAQT